MCIIVFMTITVYIAASDAKILADARRTAKRQKVSLSYVIINKLAEYVAGAKI